MKRIIVIMAILPYVSCFSSEEPSIAKQDFPLEMAKVVCEWTFNCCDDSEMDLYMELEGTKDKNECMLQLMNEYNEIYQDADPGRWNSKEAQHCVDAMLKAANECPRNFDPSYTIAQCNLVTGTIIPGKSCQNNWECNTKFCKNGICAYPIEAGKACSVEEPCESSLRCIEGICLAQKGNDAQCTSSQECLSGSCGGDRCVGSTTYLCDGK